MVKLVKCLLRDKDTFATNVLFAVNIPFLRLFISCKGRAQAVFKSFSPEVLVFTSAIKCMNRKTSCHETLTLATVVKQRTCFVAV